MSLKKASPTVNIPPLPIASKETTSSADEIADRPGRSQVDPRARKPKMYRVDLEAEPVSTLDSNIAAGTVNGRPIDLSVVNNSGLFAACALSAPNYSQDTSSLTSLSLPSFLHVQMGGCHVRVYLW